jgi:hypothetical protein
LKKNNTFDSRISVKGDIYNYYELIECLYDLETKTIALGDELNAFPNENDLEFKKEEIVFLEISNRNLIQTKIVDIVYEEYELKIIKGNKPDKYWIKKFPDVKFDANTLYAIKIWKPFYILEDGRKIKWEHELYHISKNDSVNT